MPRQATLLVDKCMNARHSPTTIIFLPGGLYDSHNDENPLLIDPVISIWTCKRAAGRLPQAQVAQRLICAPVAEQLKTNVSRSLQIRHVPFPDPIPEHFAADKSLRRYGATIERALASWEIAPEEWADYIAFLARLLKAIQAHPKDSPILPQSSAVATRLAQCLNPALPSGVHQKALEVYNYIFDTFGSRFIANHLHEYLPGIAGVLSFASLSVRPGLYFLFEEHIITLSASDLRPALKSLILSLLPALEDESGEDFERAFKILESLEASFSAAQSSDNGEGNSNGYFWQCLFLTVITSSSRRQGALNFLSRRLPKFATLPSADTKKRQALTSADDIIVPEPGLLIRCFVCGLSDQQALIQRGFLDLLVTHLPLNSFVLKQKVGDDELDRLVTAATQVLLRRDMGLNRRLWSWFLGPETKDQTAELASPGKPRLVTSRSDANSQIGYFLAHGKASLQRCILRSMRGPKRDAAERARPFRICLSLMDRWEIGGILLPDIFMPAMTALYTYSMTASSSEVLEVVRSASLFFDGVEATLIWRSLLIQLHDALGSRPSSTIEAVNFIQWVIKTFNVKDEEMLLVHIPHMLSFVMSFVHSGGQQEPTTIALLGLASQLLKLIPASAFQKLTAAKGNNSTSSQAETSCAHEEYDTRKSIISFYSHVDESPDVSRPAIDPDFTGFIVSKAVDIAIGSFNAGDAALYTSATTLLIDVSSKAGEPAISKIRHSSETFFAAFNPSADSATNTLAFPIIGSAVSLLLKLRTSTAHTAGGPDLAKIVPLLVGRAWEYLSPERASYHVEAVKTIWQLEELIPADTMVATLTDLLRKHSETDNAQWGAHPDAVRRFMILWNHTMAHSSNRTGSGRRKSSTASASEPQQARRSEILQQPLLLVLDLLSDPTDPAFNAVKVWTHHLPSLGHVLHCLLSRLEHSLPSEPILPNRGRKQIRDLGDHVRESCYILTHFEHLLQHGVYWTWQCLAETSGSNGPDADDRNGLTTLARLCSQSFCTNTHDSERLNRQLLAVLQLLLSSPLSMGLRALDLDIVLLERLPDCLASNMHFLQGDLLQLLSVALRLRLSKDATEAQSEARPRGSISAKSPPLSSSRTFASSAMQHTSASQPPPGLFKCVQLGFSSQSTRYHLDDWIAFLSEVLPLFSDVIFPNLIPLVECFCRELQKTHDELIALTHTIIAPRIVAPDSTIIHLLEGLEMVLDRAYENLIVENAAEPAPKSSETSGSFLSNVTSGVFKVDGPANKTANANNRLTVILALHDSIRVILRLWLWASKPIGNREGETPNVATMSYYALKVRNKTRHLLEQIFTVEPLESLEVIMSHWCAAVDDATASSILSLLHVMQVSRPKTVVPATLDALHSRTSPSTLPAPRLSSQTLQLSPSDVALFFSAYLQSTEDDATDEIWQDCISFLRDVLANPLPYRQVLPNLLSLLLLLAEKLSNTNYGEQRKMRRDLGDIFQRLLTATFTTLPSGYVAEPADPDDDADHSLATRYAMMEHSNTLISVLNRVVVDLDLILENSERTTASINSISTSLVSPILRAKSFPKNVSLKLLSLIVHMAQKAPTSKAWKKDVTDAFGDPKILLSSPEIMIQGWFPLLHQWSLHDKERMPELLSRLAPPSTAGIMFGVGASAARLDADRKTQLNLRRICILLLSSPQDTHVTHLQTIEEKIAELFEVTASSSPSTAIKADLFLLCRTLTLTISTLHLAPLWPIINDKLQAAMISMLPSGAGTEGFNNLALFQACKLLDLLVAISPDDFQLHEWLYITDTIDAVYQPAGWSPVALADHVAAALESNNVEEGLVDASGEDSEQTLLSDSLAVDNEDVKAFARDDFTGAVLRPFLSRLSIHAYEGVYSMKAADRLAIRRKLLGDILDLRTVVE